MKRLIFLGVLLVSGCAEKISAPCPQIVPYSVSEQKTLANELRAHPDLKEAPRWLGDYIGLRDQVRACQKNME